MQFDNFLSKFGLKYDDLREEEREYLVRMVERVSKKQVTVKDIEESIKGMIESVARELSSESLSRRKDVFLKARLKNYLLLYDILTAPEKAKKALEKQLKNAKNAQGF